MERKHQADIKEPVLFCLGSPFQCLCALSAIRQLDIADYRIMIPFDDPANSQKLSSLLDSEGVAYMERERVEIAGLWKYLFREGRYGTAFIGDYYFCGWGRNCAVAHLKRGAKIYYLDDGSSTMNIVAPHPVKYPSGGLKAKALKAFRSAVRVLKGIDDKNLFTLFDLTSRRYKIVKNDIAATFGATDGEGNGSVIIGTNPTVLPFAGGKSYVDYLKAAVAFIRKGNPSGPVYYCPHRGDSTLPEYLDMLKENQVELFDTTVAVEYDFHRSGIVPSMVVGFSSTALYTLKYIYAGAKVYNVYVSFTDPELDKGHEMLRDYYKACGIETLHLV